MNMHVTPEQQRQATAYAEVRARLTNPLSKASQIVALEARIAELEEELSGLRTVRVMRMEELAIQAKESIYKVEQLELDVADLQARILTQAKMLSELDGQMSKRGLRPVDAIVADVLRDFPGITWEDMKGIRRSREFVRPRQACMHAVYTERKDLSLPAVGRIFGGRDHTTILYAYRKIEAMKSEG